MTWVFAAWQAGLGPAFYLQLPDEVQGAVAVRVPELLDTPTTEVCVCVCLAVRVRGHIDYIEYACMRACASVLGRGGGGALAVRVPGLLDTPAAEAGS